MKHSWTGGQYSVWRAAFAVSLWIPLDRALEGWAYRLPVAALCLALALGLRDRLAAWLLAAVWWAAFHRIRSPGSPGVWSVVLLLLLHGTTHGAPYGALDARGRVDPAGGWILPGWNLAARRLLAVAAAAACVARGHLEIPWGLGLALILSVLDPGWIPPRRAKGPASVFYDGACGLCHRLVRFLLAEDPNGREFRLAPLQGSTFLAAYPAEVRQSYPDSIVVRDEAGNALIRSRAILLTMDRLGGLWRALAWLSRLVPAPLRDVVYDGVAYVRHRVFARPDDACPVVPAHLARRFDP